jgi:nucleotide-binding universal stress UspA family protein
LEIVEAAKEDVADLIITGSRGHSAWAGAALGSVSQRILHLAPCPVLVVPGE